MTPPPNLKEWRRRHGLTVHAAARLLGVHHRTYQRWERRNSLGKDDKLLTLAIKMLDITLER